MSRWPPLLGVIAFLGFDVVIRCTLTRRRYGTWGVTLFRDRQSGQLFRDSMGVVLCLVMFAQASMVALRPRSWDSSFVFHPPGWIGAVLMLAGVAAIFLAQGHLGALWRMGIDESAPLRLVTGGAYRFCRNPIFSAMLVTILGFTLMVPTWTSLVMLVGAAIGIRSQVRAEERYLIQTRGESYRQYARDVGGSCRGSADSGDVVGSNFSAAPSVGSGFNGLQ